jgi:hypothetical protein
MNRRQLAAWAGMIGPALFVAIFTLEGWLRPGYNPLSMFVSELSLGPRGWVQIVNFIMFGALLLIFARGVAGEFRQGKASKAGPILLTIVGFSLLVSGPLVMDPASTPRDLMSWHSKLHWLFGALVFTLAPASCFVFLRRFWSDPDWRWMRSWTLFVAVLTLLAVIVMSFGTTRPPAPPAPLSSWVGLIQRAILIPYAAWICTFGWGLLRRE